MSSIKDDILLEMQKLHHAKSELQTQIDNLAPAMDAASNMLSEAQNEVESVMTDIQALENKQELITVALKEIAEGLNAFDSLNPGNQ